MAPDGAGDERGPERHGEVAGRGARDRGNGGGGSEPGAPCTPGVERVLIEEQTIAFDYVRWSSVGAITLLGQAALVLF